MPEIFKKLIGIELSAIVFVRDYLQIQFDMDIITLNTWPIIKINQINTRFEEDSYKNVLCEFISKKLEKVEYVQNKHLTMFFEQGLELNVDLKDNIYNLPELVCVKLYSGDLEVFN